MGFLAAAPVVMPMLIGAGAGALIDKNNPLRGAMLGAVGGSALGPAMAGMSGAGAAAGEAAIGAGMGEAASTAAAQTAAAQGLTGLAAESPLYNAMIGEQIAGMGAPGMQHYLGSAGVGNLGAKAATLATMGPQGIIEGMGMSGNSFLNPKTALRMGSQMMIQGQPQPQQTPPATAGAAPARQAPPFQPVSRFITGMPNMNRRKEQEDRFWGNY